MADNNSTSQYKVGLLNEHPIERRYSRSSHLLADPNERKTRAQLKRRLVLRFLRDEIWTVTEVIACLLGLGYPAAHAVLKAMKRDGLIVAEECFIPAKRGVQRIVLHGITAQGLAYAWDLDEVSESRTPWEPSKTSAQFVPHQIETQLARVRAQIAGWQRWRPARSLMRLGLPKLPDAEAICPEGEPVAIEIEREIKTDKRYEAVIGAYIAQMKKDGRWSRVDYVCPSSDFAARLARVFGRLRQLRLEIPGKAAKVGELQQVHLDRFRFYSAEDWPQGTHLTPQLMTVTSKE